MVGRADEVNRIRPIAIEARPREIDVPVAYASGAVGLDRRLVVEEAKQVRRRRAVRHNRCAIVLETVLRRVGRIRAAGVPEAGDKYVAERLRASRRVVRALRAEEGASVGVPRNYWVAGACRPGLRELRVW